MSNQLSDYFFDLPDNLIANFPVVPRDSSKLLHYENGVISDYLFSDLVDILPINTLLIFNDTKVIKARLKFFFGSKNCEIFFATDMGDNHFEVLCKPSRVFSLNATIELPGGVTAYVESITSDGLRILKILNKNFDLIAYLDTFGQIPLPPYIDISNRAVSDYDALYQTIYARNLGSVAAPTAGLHFTDELMSKLNLKGIRFAFVTLQVGLGTFMPIRTANILDHNMHTEKFFVSKENADLINNCKISGFKIVSVGTTTLRVLQTLYYYNRKIVDGFGETDIFLYPGFEDWYIDGLITNFHLPKSTLFILVSALVGLDTAKFIYKHAISNLYRFFSFGDSSLLWRDNA